MIRGITADMAAKTVRQGRLPGFFESAVDPNHMRPVPCGCRLLQIADYGQHAADVLVLAEQMEDPHLSGATSCC